MHEFVDVFIHVCRCVCLCDLVIKRYNTQLHIQINLNRYLYLEFTSLKLLTH